MQDIPFSFETAGFSFQRLDWPYLPMNNGKMTSIQQRMPFDDEGVSVRAAEGKYYDHPVRQAQFLMSRLDQFHYNQDQAYLDLCIRHAERLISRSIESRSARYLPYRFAWNLHRFEAEPMETPWFSGMSQGYALSAFCRMYAVMGDERYLAFAHQLFQSFLNMREAGVPWIVDLVDDRFLWFEEYPRDNGPSDRAFNGHLYAVYGLYDYWLLTGDERAQTLADGGLTSVLGLLDKWRFPGGQSFYCLTHRERTASYHATHAKQIGVIYDLTADPVWLTLQDLFMDDYPTQVYPEPNRNLLVVSPGTYTVGARGGLDISERIEVTIEEQINLPLDLRGRLHGEMTVSARVNSDEFKFLWFPEIPWESYIIGICEHMTWAHPRTMTLTSDDVVCIEFDELGEELSRAKLILRRGDIVMVNERALIKGEVWMRLSSGKHTGSWVQRSYLADPEPR